MGADRTFIGKTKVIIEVKGMSTIQIDSPETMHGLIVAMSNGMNDLLGFKDVNGSMVFVATKEILFIEFIPQVLSQDVTS